MTSLQPKQSIIRFPSSLADGRDGCVCSSGEPTLGWTVSSLCRDCGQHDMPFDTEHLQLFGLLDGMPSEKIPKPILFQGFKWPEMVASLSSSNTHCFYSGRYQLVPSLPSCSMVNCSKFFLRILVFCLVSFSLGVSSDIDKALQPVLFLDGLVAVPLLLFPFRFD